MQKKIHFLSNHKFSFPHTNNFPSSHHDFPSFSCPKSLHFPSFSSKTNTIPLPFKPSKTSINEPINKHHIPSNDTFHNHTFSQKTECSQGVRRKSEQINLHNSTLNEFERIPSNGVKQNHKASEQNSRHSGSVRGKSDSGNLQNSGSLESGDNFQNKMLFLDSIGVDMFNLADHHRQIVMSASIADIKSTVDLFTSMHFSTVEFRRLVTMCPEILGLNSSSIIPILTFLLREARVDGYDLKKVINRRPRLLVSSVKDRLRPTLYFLQSIGIAEVNKHTYLLSCSVEEKLIPRMDYFEKMGFQYKEAVSMFRKFPPLFNYSIKENVEPKWNYFVVEMGRDLKELKEFPQYFSFSLENRIKPRHQSCVEKGVYFPLRTLLKTNREQFLTRLEVCCNSSMPLSTSPLFSCCTKN